MMVRLTGAVLLLMVAAGAAQAQGMMPTRPAAIVPLLPAIPAPPAKPEPVTIVRLGQPDGAAAPSGGPAACARSETCTWDPLTRREACVPQPGCTR